MAEQKLDLSQFAAREVAQTARVRRRSCGASLSIPARTRAAVDRLDAIPAAPDGNQAQLATRNTETAKAGK